jgi:hypothetical protein
LRTTGERWFDAILIASAALVPWILGRRSASWEGLLFATVAACLVLGRHVIVAMAQVWAEIAAQPRGHLVESSLYSPNDKKESTFVPDPRPPYFRVKLMGVAVASIGLLTLPPVVIKRYMPPVEIKIFTERAGYQVKDTEKDMELNVWVVLKNPSRESVMVRQESTVMIDGQVVTPERSYSSSSAEKGWGPLSESTYYWKLYVKGDDAAKSFLANGIKVELHTTYKDGPKDVTYDWIGQVMGDTLGGGFVNGRLQGGGKVDTERSEWH